MKVLQVIRSAYRCTVEEQDDPIVWLTLAMRAAGADLAVLLTGAAANYALVGQDASGLQLGGWAQSQPPDLPRDVAALVDRGVEVYAVREDLAERGILDAPRVDGIEVLPRSRVADLFESVDQVWHW